MINKKRNFGIFLLIVYLQLPILAFLGGLYLWVLYGYKINFYANDFYKNKLQYIQNDSVINDIKFSFSDLEMVTRESQPKIFYWNDFKCYKPQGPECICKNSKIQIYIEKKFITPERDWHLAPFGTKSYYKFLFEANKAICSPITLFSLLDKMDYKDKFPRCFFYKQIWDSFDNPEKLHVLYSDKQELALITTDAFLVNEDKISLIKIMESESSVLLVYPDFTILIERKNDFA